MKIFQKFVCLGLLIVLVLLPLNLVKADVEELIKQKKEELKKIDEQIDKYDDEIAKKKKEVRTLENEKAIIEKQIAATSLEIKKTHLAIEETSFFIQKTIGEIEKIETQIGRQKVLLVEYIRIIHNYDQESLLEIILKQKDFSDFFDTLAALEVVQRNLQEALNRIKLVRVNLEEEKLVLEKQQQEQNQLRLMQEAQKYTLGQQRDQKKKLVLLTKDKEAEFQKILKQQKGLYSQISAEIFRLETLGEPINFDDAVREAKFASSKTGVRPAFLLGILKVESNLGQNVGRGNYKTDMKSDQQSIFEKICQELALDANAMPVSAKPTTYQGWGGAMGPAQFMPSTWLLYKDKVASITGSRIANPWNLRDAMTAMALKVAEISGVTKHNRNAEYKAAGIYFAGNNWQRFTWYADQVLKYADIYEQSI